LLQLLALEPAWRDFHRLWVTNDRAGARSLLAGERVVWAHWPTSRNLPNLVRNCILAVRVIRRTRPRVLLTTGAATAVPFAWVARLFGAAVVYVESVTRIDSPSLSYSLIRPVASRIYVQWPELAVVLPGVRYRGSVLPT
jgi:UDP-N-acetylglucosamine:LPS N-acetylglucosamine transferase